MRVYLDIIFFENACMNYIILYATGIVMKNKVNHKRIIAASIIGSAYAIIVYLKISNITSNVIVKICVSVAMVWLSFNEKKCKTFFKDILMFYMISFVFGGCALALIYFISPQNVKINNGVLVGLYPIKVTLLASTIAFVIIQIAFKITKNKLSSKDLLCKIEIQDENKKIEVKALVDTGNLLKDPISGSPVIIVEMEKLKSILPLQILSALKGIKGGDELEKIEDKYMNKIRLIPFSSLGKENGMLVGIKVEKIKIIFKETEEYSNDIIVGIYNKKINKDGKYNALVGLNLMEKMENTKNAKVNA